MAESVCSTALRCLSSTQQFHSRAKREWRACAYFTQSAVPAFPRGGYHRLSSDTKSFRLSSRNVYYGFSSGVLSSSFHVRCAADSGDGDGRTSVSTEESKTEPPSEKELGAPHHKGSLLHSPETNDGLADFGEETNGSSRTLLHNPQTDDSAAESALESSGANGSVKDESSTDEVEDTRLRLEGSLGSVVEAAEKVAEAAVEVVSETVEVAVQTVSTVGEIVDPPLVEEPVVDQGVALKTVAFWVSAAVAFGTIVGFKEGTSKASEFFAGYLLEQSLSVDNLFVFVLIFNYFRVPYAYQSRVLTYGIAGAVVFRATMIGLGIASLERFEALNLLFAAILIFSSVKLFTESEEEDDDLSNNFIVKLCRKILPVTSSYDGHKFLTVADGVTKATPLLLTLIVVEISDIAFAVDSIPAVFGVTRDPFIVFSSNIFAILGLRSLYTIISGSMAELQYLQPSVGVVLGFIGVKMVCEYFGFSLTHVSWVSENPKAGMVVALLYFYGLTRMKQQQVTAVPLAMLRVMVLLLFHVAGFHVPTEASLGVVAAVLGVGIALSLKDSPKED